MCDARLIHFRMERRVKPPHPHNMSTMVGCAEAHPTSRSAEEFQLIRVRTPVLTDALGSAETEPGVCAHENVLWLGQDARHMNTSVEDSRAIVACSRRKLIFSPSLLKT